MCRETPAAQDSPQPQRAHACSQVAQYAVRSLLSSLETPPLGTQPEDALHLAFVTTDELLRHDVSIQTKYSGCTALCALFGASSGGGYTLWVAHAGDSRLVMASASVTEEAPPGLAVREVCAPLPL